MALIKNYSVYNERMNAGIKDKLWFVDFLLPEIDTIVDFGCADCSLGTALNYYYPNQYRYIGIDCDSKMREAGSQKGFVVVSSLEQMEELNINFDRAVINFSSVIHELFSYLTPRESLSLLRKVKEIGFKQIAVRDMFWNIKNSNFKYTGCLEVRRAIEKTRYRGRWIDFLEYCKRNREDGENWEIEFLLKYMYSENWEREKEERYLWNWGEQFSVMFDWNYYEEYNCDFRIPYLVRRIRQDFGIELKENTHKKLLLTKRGD